MMKTKAKLNFKKRPSAILFILIIILLIAGFAFFLYRNEIAAFANNKTNGNEGIDTETSESLRANLTDEITSAETEESTTKVPVAAVPPETEPTETAAPETTEEPTAEPVTEAPTETLTEATQPTQPPQTELVAETVTQPPQSVQPATKKPEYDPNFVIQGNYLPQMFESAIEITVDESQGKSVFVESPPLGRDLILQSKITPVNKTIPNPSEYFSDVIFLGDSVTTGFDLFRDYIKFNGEKIMLNTTVVAAKSYGIYNATRELSEKSVHPLFNGSQALPEDIIAEKESRKVFICLGLNDVSWQTPETFLNNYAALINRIREKSPEKTVYIMSITPLTAEGQKESLTNEKIMQFNNLLIEFAAYNNIPFIDYAAALRDENNHLYPELSSDNYCHVVLEAYNRLTEYMIYHTIGLE